MNNKNIPSSIPEQDPLALRLPALSSSGSRYLGATSRSSFLRRSLAPSPTDRHEHQPPADLAYGLGPPRACPSPCADRILLYLPQNHGIVGRVSVYFPVGYDSDGQLSIAEPHYSSRGAGTLCRHGGRLSLA